MSVLGLRFCPRAFSSCGKRGPLFIAVRGPLTTAASLVAERRLSSCGLRAQLLRGMWDLPRPGLEPVSPALAGRFSTTAPSGKPYMQIFMWTYIFNSFGKIPGSVIAGLYDKNMLSFVRRCQTVFQSGCTILHSHQQ